MKRDKEGSVLVLILVIAASAGMLLASLSNLAITEKRLNDNARLLLEAREAAEATVECGFSQLVSRFEERTNFPINSLAPDANPVILTEDYFDLFNSGSGMTASKVQLPGYPYNPKTAWNTQDTELIAGQIPPGEWKFIDSRTPGNEEDPLQDKLVFIREVKVFGKATVENETTGYRHTAYVQQSLQVRDAPLFAHAIFYNMDMEIAPGQDMDIEGAVHANGKMYIQAGRSLDFYKNVSATGQIFHGPNPGISKGTSNHRVSFDNGLGEQISMHDGNKWIDSKLDDFGSLADNRWNGRVKGYEHGIQHHNPVAIKDYVPDNPDTPEEDDDLNYAYQIIQPLQNAEDDDYNSELEQNKFAYKAGMVVDVNIWSDDVEVYRYRYDEGGNIQYDSSGEPKKHILYKEKDDMPDFIKLERYNAKDEDVESGLYDAREGRGINLVEIDIGRLKEVVEANNKPKKGKKYWGNNGWAKPEQWWNGIVYVDFPQRTDPERPDGVIPAVAGWGLKLHNGKEIPNPDWKHEEDLYGMTLATNAPLYVQGHYNADGKKSTGSPTDPDFDDVTKEPPAALVADAVTVLSEDWEDEDSMKKLKKHRRAKTMTEVAAAILTGLVPSDKHNNNKYSGGVENFPRFLEAWGTALRYRGSMVALFESEVATGTWSYGGNVYTAPSRNWGFNSLFSEGYYPPGTPNTRTFRKVNFRDLTEAEFAAELSHLHNAFGI
jgi:hypothetical protein